MAVFNTTQPFNNVHPKSAGYGYLTLLFIPVLTILGNMLVIMAVLGDKKLKKSVTNRYIAALAFSDFLVGVIPMPLAVYVKVNDEQWNLGAGMCKFYVAFDVTSSTASILHLVVISADRYLAISWPSEYQLYARKAKITYAIVLVWLISITLSIPVVMGKSIVNTGACWLENPEYMIYSSLLSFYIPAGVLTLVYVKIFRKIRFRQGIHSMLREGGGTEVPSFNLPFVVVHEVSFNDQGSSLEKRGSDSMSLAGGTENNHQPTTTFPIELVNEYDEGDNQRLQLLKKNTVKKKSPVSKSTTFPVKTERILCGRSQNRKGRSKAKRSITENVLHAPKKTSERGQDNAGGQEKEVDEDQQQLGRTSSEKTVNNHADQSVQTNFRRYSLWVPYKCPPSGVPDAGYVVYGGEDDDDDDELITAKTSTDHHTENGYGTRNERRFNSVSLRRSPHTNTCTDWRRVRAASSSGRMGDERTEVLATPLCSRETRRSSSRLTDNDEDGSMTTCYARTASTKRKSGFYFKKLANRVSSALHRMTETQAVTKEKKATKLVALILGIFIISWLPFFTFNTARGVCLSVIAFPSGCDWLPSQIFFLTSWLGYANSAANPIIYALVNERFRATYKRLLWWPSRRHS